ncbi:MAG: hypothetical protein ACYDD1_13745 [Caulobacteraceae bacterium]
MTMLHWLFHTLLALLICAVIGGLGYGCVYLYRDAAAAHAMASQVPVLTKALADLRKTDTDAARSGTARCSANASDAFAAGVRIGRQTVYRLRLASGVQNETDSHVIRQLLGQE